jgi:hypothetical protein
MRNALASAAGVLVACAATLSWPAHAKTMTECAAEWKDLKATNQTTGMKYRDFTKQCISEGAAPIPAGKAAPTPPRATEAKEPPPAHPGALPPAPVASGNIVFPPAVSAKYATESKGRARMLTCRDQYDANKASGANGGLKWIEKGGGYYSECNKRLKGQA